MTDAIAEEIVLPDVASGGWVTAHVADYPVEVWLGRDHQAGRPVAMKVTDWIEEHVLLYARQLWWPRYRPPTRA